MNDDELQESLTQLARLTSYAEELVEDDYLWFDASASYVRGKLRRMVDMVRKTQAEERRS